MGSVQHYCDYFSVNQTYKANMTRELINETPETWMDFFPHETYLRFLDKLFDAIHDGSKSVWLHGNYGTGKSSAALVTEKLYMDDFERVEQWFINNCISDTHQNLLDDLKRQRDEGTLVIYDYNASGVGPNEEFIVRIEKTIINALKDRYKIPSSANINHVIDRLKREKDNFFHIRDRIIDQLDYLSSDISDIDELIDLIKKEDINALNLLSDIERVFHEDNIYLDVTVPSFRKWIQGLLSENNLKRIIFIFDEFSDFISNNVSNLKTFEEISEAPNENNFYFIPVTHLSLNAFHSENSKSAGKAKDRFFFSKLEMPNDVAFQLAAHAMIQSPDPKIRQEWKTKKDALWSAILPVVNQFDEKDVTRGCFYDMLPIHPMAGFLLKHLSESVSSNQRSIFEYLKGSANGREFQTFIDEGGPVVPNKRFLTVDYLWKYFIEREDLGQSKEVYEIQMYFNKLRNSEFRGYTEDHNSLRVLKTILLFVLLSRVNQNGHARLQPTIENVIQSFKGESISNVQYLVKELEEKHCFSILNGNIELYSSSVDDTTINNLITEYSGKFHELLHDKTADVLRQISKQSLGPNALTRYNIIVTSSTQTNLTKFSNKTNYGKDSNQICLWFVISKNHEEQLTADEKIYQVLNTVRDDYRVIMITFDKTTFCSNQSTQWDEYIKLYARYISENDSAAKNQLKNGLEKIETEWADSLKASNFTAYQWNEGDVEKKECTWGPTFHALTSNYVRRTLPYSLDYISQNANAYNVKISKPWIQVGLNDPSIKITNQYKPLIENVEKTGINDNTKWYETLPEHPFTKIRERFESKRKNIISKNENLSIRKVFMELQRAPYGLEANAFSAYAIGYCLREWLDKDFQCTDEKITEPLTIDNLAEIIKDGIEKASTNEKPRNERFICKLSKEDKAFIEKAPLLFNAEPMKNSTTVETINLIESRIDKISNRVPLWVMSEYITEHETIEPEIIQDVINSFCIALKTSSKGNTADRYAAVRKIGTYLLNEPEKLIEVFTKYMSAEYFENAFIQYVDKHHPDLTKLATNADDQTHAYCRSILDKTAMSASTLWTEEDLNVNVMQTIKEYEIINSLKHILGISTYTNYGACMDRLSDSVFKNNKLPESIIVEEYPGLNEFLTILKSVKKVQKLETLNDLLISIEDNKVTIENLFFDKTHKESINILRSRFDIESLDDNEIRSLMESMSSGFDSDVSTFGKEFNDMVLKFKKQQKSTELIDQWFRLTNTKSITEWSINNKIPAKFAFYDYEDGEEIIDVISNPKDFSVDKIEKTLDTMNEMPTLSIEKIQQAFLEKLIPIKYQKLNITFGSLIMYLQREYGTNPNGWPSDLCVDKFIREQYKIQGSPIVISKIQNEDPDVLKKKLMKLVENNEEIGLLFWE